jgi:PP-loop superfamily ATP-utilizing enzyme
MPVRIPSPQDIDLTEKRLQTHAKKHFVGKYGVKEIRARFKNNFVLLEVIKHEKEGLVGKLFKMGSVKNRGQTGQTRVSGSKQVEIFHLQL